MKLIDLQCETCDEILIAIRKIIRSVDIHSKWLRQQAGVTSPQLIILKEIKHNKSISTTVLASKISLSQSTVTNILDRLVERNLVVRTRDTSDKRVWFLALTSDGQAIVDNSPSLLQKKFIDKFSSLPEWQQTQMVSNLQLIVSMMYD